MKHLVAVVIVCAAVSTGQAQVRMFMAADGEQLTASNQGNTTIFVHPGSTVRVMAWLDTGDVPPEIAGYQLLVPFDASALAGATGTVTYVDGPGYFRCSTQEIGLFLMPCDPGDSAACGGNPADCVFSSAGNSIFIDETRSDYLFADVFSVAPTYTEADNLTPPSFGLFVLVVNIEMGAQAEGVRYLAQFDITASADASGEFELEFRQPPLAAPWSVVTGPFGDPIEPLDLQALTIIIPECGNGIVEGDEECDDGNTEDGDGCSAQCTIETMIPAVTPVGMAMLCVVLLAGLAWSLRRGQLSPRS